MSNKNFIHYRDRLKVARKTLNLSQQAFADQISVPVHKIKDIEVGKTKMSSEIALALEDKFHLAFRWLLTGTGPMWSMEIGENEVRMQMLSKSLLKEVIEKVEKHLEAKGASIDSEKKANLIASLYDLYARSGYEVDENVVETCLDLVL